jgi:hypothetical protein
VALFGLFTRFGGPRAALAALIAGALAWPLGKFAADLSFPYHSALGTALACYVGVALFEDRDQGRV